MSNLINQEQLQHLDEIEVLDFYDHDDDLFSDSSLEQHLEQEEYQQAEPQAQALSRNDQDEEEAAHTTLSLMPQFPELNCSSATTTFHPQTRPRNPMKRPFPSSLLDQQMAKKLQLLESQENNHSLHGFTKLALPIPQNQPPVTPLLRTASAPAFSLNHSNHFLDPVWGFNGNANANVNSKSSVSPEQVGVNPSTPSPVKGSPSSVSRKGVDSGSVKPPLPPTIRHSVSDPRPVSGGGTSVNQSPLSKRLRMMKNDLKSISHWFDRVIHGEEEERKAASEEKDNATKDHETENGTQEAVSVEVKGDCLSLHFNCPCGKGYQILLTGKNCYYKLV